MKCDDEGFLYPVIDATHCIDCGLCERVCTFRNLRAPQQPIEIGVYQNPDYKIRDNSSSGGIMSMLASAIINRGGVVFGARFNDRWEVEHDYIDKLENLSLFQGSKYIQSSIGNSFHQVESFLKKGQEVMFSGTPCQISALRLFLNKDYTNLLTVSIACHSVPSPLIWRVYLDSLGLKDITNINFRDKSISWEDYGLRIKHGKGREFFQSHTSNLFLQLFLHGLICRPSCSNCPAKDGRSGADLILGDCWGLSQILPDYPNDHRGTSLVLTQTEVGSKALEETGIKGESVPLDQVIQYNGGLTSNQRIPQNRSAFWRDFHKFKDKRAVLRRYARSYMPSFRTKLSSIINHIRNK